MLAGYLHTGGGWMLFHKATLFYMYTKHWVFTIHIQLYSRSTLEQIKLLSTEAGHWALWLSIASTDWQ